MAGERRGGRERGKSDPIDALAVARVALREPDLPVARLDGPARELRLLGDHRYNLVKERTRWHNRLRWRECLVFCVRGGVRGVSPFYQMPGVRSSGICPGK